MFMKNPRQNRTNSDKTEVLMEAWASLLTATTWLQLGINIYFFILIIRKAISGKKQT